ncbi:Radial spoke head protein 9 [Kappamyces sp. JEL0829]|nr:Radial spoke head protein 9 [Kappamyces sp. JEL0829]
MAFYSLDTFDTFNLAGFTLNAEERATLRNSLIIKQDEEKLSNITLWGKLLGIQQDYFIAQGFQTDLFKRKYFYTLDNTTWFELPSVTPSALASVEKIQGRLLGDPAAEHDVPKETGGLEDFKIKEDVRIAGIIQLINHDVEIVPRKMYYRDSSMTIKHNPDFKGLESDEIGLESSYQHFREGYQLNARTLAERMNSYDDTIDIFESIERDQPQGAWSIQTERSGTVALVRSLVWPGYSLTHTRLPVTATGFYHGTGIKNHNIGFML